MLHTLNLWGIYLQDSGVANLPVKTGSDNSKNVVSGQSQNCFGNLEIFSGNRDTWKFSRETRDNSGTLQKKSGHRRKFYFTCLLKIREDGPNFRDDLS